MTSLKPTARYNFSFMGASLRPELARIVAETYLATGDWDKAKTYILSSNALQCRGAQSSIRLERELRQRLQTLTPEQLRLLVTATAADRAALAWLATIKQAPFVFEFAVEVLRDKLACGDHVLRYSDYETYVEARSVAHPELARLSPSSRNKIRQILLGMLAEAGLTTVSGRATLVQRPLISPIVRDAVLRDAPHWLAGFLLTDDEIGAMR